MGIEIYKNFLGLRYETFFYAFEEFRKYGGTTIVELGTMRSFVSGGYEGCMINDAKYWQPDKPETWDWGAGLFTRMCAFHLHDLKPKIHSVDISEDAIEVSRTITSDFSDLITYHHQTSEDFLKTFPGKIDLLYMDAGETHQGADFLHFWESKIVVERDLLSQNGIILIDDVNVPGQQESKGTYSIPLLSASGYTVKLSGYQVVMQRKG